MNSINFTTICFLLSLSAVAQKGSMLLGNWQYWDNKRTYHEIVIDTEAIYIYGDSSNPAKVPIHLHDSEIVFSPRIKWTILQVNNNNLIIQSKNEKIKLYQMQYEEDNVKEFYLWIHHPERTGNGYSIFSEYFIKRKKTFTTKIKGSSRN